MTRPAPGPIQVISASAGSGKTHRLVNELEAALIRGDAPVRPEAVVATTFTVKAAAELRERVRSRLLERELADKAQRLGAARIGTVNSICSQLVTEFAFDLGVSPETEVLDEEAADAAFRHALSGLVSSRHDEGEGAITACSAAAAELMTIGERFHDLDWLDDVKKLASLARANRIGPAALRTCAARSADGLLAHFQEEAGDATKIEKALEEAIERFLASPLDETKTTKGVKASANQALAQLKARRALMWWTWAKLAAEEPAAGSKARYEPVRLAARGYERHPGLRQDLRRAIELVFELAAEALEAYAAHKRDWGLIDFIDQETLALDLLGRPGVQEMLREQIDLVLVDEFQDTSPLQLEIFLALAALAARSVWVGDQKQSIFGFRGTDPALMDAAVDALIARDGGKALTTLGESWRSRAELVRLTSDVFAPAFARSGIPADRVRLEPAKAVADAPDTLGPVVESWFLGGKTKDQQAVALAAAVRQLLDDPQAPVRDIVTNEPRRVQAGDVAILCRTGDNCARVTAGLEALGIPAVRPRAGLMKTLEARLALAALQLWVDPRQSLAAAEIGRLLADPGDGDAWLSRVLDTPGEAYLAQPEVQRIADAAARLPLAGPLTALDAVMEAAGVREACLGWGRSEQRLGNLDALRAYAHGYVVTCEREGGAATVAGLVSYLRGLDDGESDEQATPSGADAVTVSTLHGAKGLEWPVTVLHEIDSTHAPTAFGLHMASDRERLDFADPLGGRWLRYWPDPFSPQSRTTLHEAVSRGPEHEAAAQQSTREMLRLLYVGWTRARDRVVLAGRPGKIVGKTLGLLVDSSGNPLIAEPQPSCTWAGRPVEVLIRNASPDESQKPVPEPGLGYDASGPRDYPPARGNISEVPGGGALGTVEVVAPAPFVQPPVEWAALGDAVHGFLAADSPEIGPAERLELAVAVLERWSVQGALRSHDLVSVSDSLRAWVERRWPGARWHREWPVRLRQAEGTELVGYADLVVVDGDSFVLVDHKCLGSTRDEALAASVGYAGQVWTYADAIARATAARPAGCFVHLVLQGLVVGITDLRH
jgi:ATP-dependent helicase/nuclease subunit A